MNLLTNPIHMYIFFFISFPLWFITGYWIAFPVLYSRTLLLIHSIYSSLCLLIPGSRSIPPPLLLRLGVCSVAPLCILNGDDCRIRDYDSGKHTLKESHGRLGWTHTHSLQLNVCAATALDSAASGSTQWLCPGYRRQARASNPAQERLGGHVLPSQHVTHHLHKGLAPEPAEGLDPRFSSWAYSRLWPALGQPEEQGPRI